MIVYSGDIKTFRQQVFNNDIADYIEECFRKHGINHNNEREHRAFENSLRFVSDVVAPDRGVNQDLKVAIEYQIPTTSKRVDFIVTGLDQENKSNVIIIELKQWNDCDVTDKNNIVLTYVAKAFREETHPSYQAYSYAKTIENFNESVEKQNYLFHPCAYLHNFEEKNKSKIEDPRYHEIIDCAPVFLKKDAQKLTDFINKYIKKPDDGSILYTIDNGKIKPSIALQDEIIKMLKGNDSFQLLDEQKIAYETIYQLVRTCVDNNNKHTIIIKGGPGTGKSVIAIKVLASLIKKGYNVIYCSKNAAPRNVYYKNLTHGDFKNPI